MRIGVPLRYALPECGGGHTFEREVLESLAGADVRGRHEVVLFGASREPPPGFRPAPFLRYVSLHADFADLFREDPAGTAARTGKALIRLVRDPAAPFRVDEGFEGRLAGAVRSERIDLVWSLGPGTPAGEAPHAATVWDLQHRLQPFFPEVSRDGTWENREALYGTVLRRAALVFTGTEAGKAEIERFYQVPPGCVRVLPLPTPRFALEAADAPAADVRALHGLPERFLFYPSQFWPHKNHVGLLHALRVLRDEHGLPLTLVLSGSDQGNEGHVRAAADALGLGGQVRFLGFVPREELAGLYRSALALVFVSFFGPDNLPPLEAFALGCPVVASRVDGAREQLGDAALLADPRDEREIAAAVRALHDDPALAASLAARGRERARSWTGREYVEGALSAFDGFARVRRCWP